jgi:peptidoglycan/xylan/chitin deacetylase (PgdA/CDA1 family)
LVNPRTGAGNICKVDPSFGNGVVNESNENNNTCADTVSVIVPPTITITPATLATGIVGTSYGQTLNAVTTALPPFTWTILSGALPGGLSLGSTGNSTDLTGTPTTAGTFNFTANVTNGTSSSTQAYAISIAPAVATTTPPITGANLIINPQVETISTTTPTLPYAWTNGGFGTNTAVYTYPATNTPVSEIANGNAIRVSVTNYTDGDAKWIFNPVAVTPNDQYVFTDAYISDVPTQLAAEFLDAQGNVISFGGWATVPPSSSWTNATAKFTAPAGSAFMTVFHLLQSNGTLTTDNYNLIALPPSIPFDNGMVSITFDDGWKSQYENAFPILQNAGLKGSFYIITNAIAATSEDNPNVLCNDPAQTSCNGATIIATPSVWTAGTQYPDPAQKTYTFADTYTATTTSTITISYFDQNGQPISGQQNIVLGTAPAGTSQTTSLTFTIPDSVFSIISTSTTPHTSPLFSISHAVTAGQTITVTNGSLREPASPVDSYMSAAQILALQSAGDEVSAHTQDHCNLALLYSNPNLATSTGCASPQATAKTALEEISGSRSAMLALGATPVDTFVYPYGGFDANIETLVQQTGFVGARSVLLGYNTRGSDKYALNTQIIDAKLTTDPNGLATAKAWIDYAKANKVWLILTLHGVFTQNQWNGNVALNPNSVNDATTDTFFQNVVNYLKQSSVCVVTFHDGMQAMNSTTNPCTPVVVPPTNSAPTLDPINNQTVATGTPVAFTAHGVDLDVGDTLTYGISSLPTGATFNTTTGVFSWTPTSSDIGAHVFTVTVTDNHGAKATQDVTITVTVPVIIPTNHAPVANNLTATTTKNTALSVHLVATDADGDVVTYATSTNPTHGTLTGTLPLLTYTPATDFVGIDSFTFTAHDATSTSNIATVTINIASTSSATTTDTIAPIITLNGASTTNLTLGSAYTELGATALDNVDTTTPITIGGDTVNINLAGTYHVTYDAVDSSGNHAIQMIRTIIINSPAPTPTPTPAPASGGGGGGGNGPIAVKTYGIFDFNNLLINWGKTGAGLAGDFNGDNTVDLLDFNLMLTNWTK